MKFLPLLAAFTLLATCLHSFKSFLTQKPHSDYVVGNQQQQQHWSRRRIKAFSTNVPIVPFHYSSEQYTWMDLYNALGRNRTLFLSRYLDDETCSVLLPSLVWLDSENHNPITIYLNIPGGSIQSGLTIYDVMTGIRSPIKTINIGLTTGIGCLIAAAGTYGMRFATMNSRFCLGRTGLDDKLEGPYRDVLSEIQSVSNGNSRALEEIAFRTRRSLLKVKEEFQKDFYLSALEAVTYGLVDGVIKPNWVEN
jgi:ATP-dependent Clp protease protease subunit